MCKDGSQSTEQSVTMYDSDMHKDFPLTFLWDFLLVLTFISSLQTLPKDEALLNDTE
jgi:hypothetical protein